MRRKIDMIRLAMGTVVLMLAILAPTVSVATMDQYCATPPYMSNSVPPNVMIVLDNSGSMNDQAYAGTYNPTQFGSGHYYGYFDPTANYQYNGSRWVKTTADFSTATTSNPIASGDFLNWATTRRIDAAKKLLIGGNASPRSPNGNVTVKLTGEDGQYARDAWDFVKDYDNTGAPGVIAPFSGNYRYAMKNGNNLDISPMISGSTSARAYPDDNVSAPASWTVSGTSSTWRAVDEAHADGNMTYIQNRSDKDPILFDYDFSGSKTGTIASVSVVVVAKKVDTDDHMRLQGVLQVGGDTYASHYANLSQNYDRYIFQFDKNPDTGDAWAWNDIKSSGVGSIRAFGVQARTSPDSTIYPRVTQVYLEISTTSPSGGPYTIIVDQGMQKAEGLIDHLSNDARFGLAFYNSSNEGGHVENDIDFDAPTNMITSIANMHPDTNTPLAETLYEMVRYFSQQPDYGGEYAPYYNNSPADYQVGQNYDPYYFHYSKVAGSNLPDQYVKCAKSFVLMLTDGEPTRDEDVPNSLKDFDQDGVEDEPSEQPTYYNNWASDYLDDIALWARTTDHRSDLDGDQNVVLYDVFMFGRGSQLLKDASINGGFNDLNGDGKPGPDLAETRRDSNGDGVITADDLPLTYFEGDDGYQLEASITEAIASILKRAASGTAVSVLTTSSRGVGSIVQAYFLPVKQQGVREVTWTGNIQDLWVDPDDNLREDSDQNFQLELDKDKVLKLFFDDSSNETKAATFTTDAEGKNGTLASCSDPQVHSFSDVKYLWEGGKKLSLQKPSTRTLFTAKNVIHGTSSQTLTSSGPEPDFTTGMDSSLKATLDPDATYTADDIIRYIRGECLETGVTGDTACAEAANTTFRDRRISVSGGDANGNVWKLGDIISSTPKVLAGTPVNTYQYDYGDRTYYDYVTSDNYKNRSSIAFVGANDGVLHAFRVGYLKDKNLSGNAVASFQNFFDPDGTIADASGTDHLGEEIWGYIPFNAFPYLKYLAKPNYCHLYYNDLSVKLVDASLGCDTLGCTDPDPDDTRQTDSWKTILVGGMRFGGACSGGTPAPPITGGGYSAYYAIDITDPEQPKPLWEFSDDALGYTSSQPAILRAGGKSENGNWYVAFGSGSQTLPKGTTDIGRTDPGYIYILNLKTGDLVKKIGLGDDAVVGDILSIDANKDYDSEKIYFGTAYQSSGAWKGKLMSLAIPSSASDIMNLCGAGVTRTSAQCEEVSPDPEKILFSGDYPFTASPDVTKDADGNIWVYAGSGKYYSDQDETDTSDQIFLGVKDVAGITYPVTVGTNGFEDRSGSANDTVGTVSGTSQVCTYDSSSTSFGYQAEVTSVSQTSDKVLTPAVGWYQLLTNGERVITRPLAVGGVVDVLTYKPDNDPCSYGGKSYLYALGYTTGVAPSTVAIRSPDATTATGTGTSVIVNKKILLGPGAPPTGDAIIIPPPKEGQEQLEKKIQIATGVIVEAKNNPVTSVVSKIVHWLDR